MFKLLLFLSIFVIVAHAQLIYNPIIGSNMVLQRDSPYTKIWGNSTAESGSKIQIHFIKENKIAFSVEAVVQSDKNWYAKIPPTPVGGPYSIIIQEKGAGAFRRFENIMFGDVFLCSGQSNMEQAVESTFNATKEIEDSINYPNLRVFKAERAASHTPLNYVKGAWAVSSPRTVKQFSAVCFYYGRQLYKHLGGKVPIGMIQSTWGGTYIESWSSPDALKKCENAMKRSSDPQPNDPSALWNAMIHPLLNVNIKGFLWYQGEANWNQPEKYKCSFTEMIKDYRLKWKIGDFAFYFVQLAGYEDPDGNPMNFKAIRLAQTVVLSLPNTGMASAVDLGDPESPFHPIHPRNKQEVAHRLFVIAAHFLYKSQIDYSGPLASSISFVKENGVYSFRIMYSHINGGLKSRGSAFCVECCAKPETMFEFKVNDEWIAANELQLMNNYAIIKVKSEVQPSMVRYLWFDYPQCVVVDKNNDLPSPPFEMKI